MRSILLSLFLINTIVFSFAQIKVTPLVDYELTPAQKIKINGHLQEKLQQSYKHRILDQDIDHLITPFNNRTEDRLWQSEFWGKWATSAALAYKYNPTPELKNVLKSAVNKLISTQTKDGYIGNYAKEHRLEHWDIWGMKYCILGLLDYYDITRDRKVLKAAQKVANYVISEVNARDGLVVNKGNYRGMAASSILQPMVKLYERTKDKRYLTFAKAIVQQWETPEGPQFFSKADLDVSKRFPEPAVWYSEEQGHKAYEMMSCFEGLLELYRITGDKSYISMVEKVWQNIYDTEINIAGSGASSEMWFGGKQFQTLPVEHFQETCVTVTWLKLSLMLLQLTGDAKYADAIENSYYNALLGSMYIDGSEWAKYTPLNGQRLAGSGQCGMDLNCCNANGPRGLFLLPLYAVMQMDNGIAVNFFMDGVFDTNPSKKNNIKVIQKTDYPASGLVNMQIQTQSKNELEVRIRIPAWSKKTSLKVNNKEVQNVTAGTYAVIKRKWLPTDTIELQLDMRAKVEFRGDVLSFAAIVRGPIVLARDSNLAGPNLALPITPITDKEGYIELENLQTGKNNYWLQFSVPFLPESYKEFPAEPIKVLMSDYSSAGNVNTNSTFQVWMPQIKNPKAELEKKNPKKNNTNGQKTNY